MRLPHLSNNSGKTFQYPKYTTFWVGSLPIPRIYFLYSAVFICCCMASFQDVLMFRGFGKDKQIGEPADVI